MAEERCPKCGGSGLRRATAAWRHALRSAIGSRKRVCLACGERWHLAKNPLQEGSAHISETQVIVLASAVGVLLMAVANTAQNPSSFIKKTVRGYYDAKYGAESKTRLWSDWGWVYGRRGQAQGEYLDHPTK